ncbi:DNA cytosine methyltransferase [Stenotrophomonas sp. GD03930]|uniref:DNA cytosine methyltransferase n=1 Tax=Stenotrophomonas sp. GD03930 TaxID=2975406 RepID=UPI00244AABF0|nr:DNA cytosine methyltransferase [Stenotrophomonas sp. GD03930]MDH1232081.1 DNA cytosine methyltransferase [Stenotrophomonas sp. GD03930]
MADGSRVPEIRVARKVRPMLVADLFCGAGGLSNGTARAMRQLGLPVQMIGVNHWPVAIETNRRNHKEHADRIHCADLESALPLTIVPEGRLDLLTAAPSCVFHSRARGGRPVHDQQRMDPWHVVRWCTELRVARVLVENVPEFMDWGPCSLVTGRPIKSRRGEYFRAWVAALEAVGFKVDWKVVCCADFGDPTTRRRFFLIGRSDGKRLTWPEFTHDRVGGTDLLGSRPRWRGAREVIDWTMTGKSIFTRTKPLKPNTLRRILAGAVKYSWPRPYIDAVQALLDGQTPKLVFTRAEAVALGLVSADPMLVHLRGTSEQHLQATAKSADEPLPSLTAGGGHVGLVLATSSGGAARDLDQPLPTITTGGAGAERPGCARPQLVEPIIVPTSNTSSAGVPRSAAEPIRTVTTAKGGDQALAVPLVAQYYGATATAQSVAEPVPSVTTKARFGLAQPVLMRAGHGDSDGRNPVSRVLDADAPMPALTGSNEMALAEPIVMRGNVGTGRTGDMRRASEPMPTITCSESLALAEPFLVPNFGEAPGQTPRTHSIDDPMPTVTATGHVQLATPAADVADEVRIDINYRMLHWRELARATSFDDEGEVYDFAGNATEITKQIGNAVPNRTAKALAMGLMRDAA